MPAPASQDSCPLASVPVGSTGALDLGSVPPASGPRFVQLGLRNGATVTVLGRTAGGGRLIGVGTSRIGLDRDTSRRLGLRLAGAGA